MTPKNNKESVMIDSNTTLGEVLVYAFYKAGLLPPLLATDAEFNEAITKGNPNSMRMVVEPTPDHSISNKLKSAFVFCAYKAHLLSPIVVGGEEWEEADYARDPDRHRMVFRTNPDMDRVI